MMGAVNTVRTMGGCIALSACSAILHNEISTRVEGGLPVDTVDSLLRSPTTVLPLLDDETGVEVRRSYHEVYRLQWITVTALAATELLFALPPLFASAGKEEGVPASPSLPQHVEIDHSVSKAVTETTG